MHVFLEGAVLGFLIAAPVGPIGLLCIARTLRSGLLIGFVSGLGAATADGAYAVVAVCGLTGIVAAIKTASVPLHLGGALMLCWLGVKTLRARVDPVTARSEKSPAVAAAYASTVLLTLLNPATIVSFLAIFGALPVARAKPVSALLLITGVFCGSALWWLVLSAAVGASRRAMTDGWRRSINIVSGALLIAFAAAVIATYRSG